MSKKNFEYIIVKNGKIICWKSSLKGIDNYIIENGLVRRELEIIPLTGSY